MPGGIPNDFNFGEGDSRDTFEVGLGVVCNDGTHAATGGSERHFHAYFLSALGMRFQFKGIDEPEVDNVDRNFGIEDFFEGFPELFFFNRGIGG